MYCAYFIEWYVFWQEIIVTSDIYIYIYMQIKHMSICLAIERGTN